MANAKIKVLVVDDDRRMIKTICDILNIKGYETEAAYSGEEALEKLKSAKSDNFDCVFMDIKMPGISGIETLKIIKGIMPDIPVVMMSAYADEEQIAEGKKLGAYAVLTKPLNFQMILSFLSLIRKEESILVVDDDPAFCKTIKDILEVKGYRVKTESNPENVMSHMEENYKLTVLLDLKLGNVSGLDVLKDIRAKYPSKPVVLITGYRDEMADSIKKGMQIGAYTCLYKPLEIEKLLRLIEDIRREKVGAALEKK